MYKSCTECAQMTGLYDAFARGMQLLIRSCLNNYVIRTHMLCARAKHVDSLNDKCLSKQDRGRFYRHVQDVPDIAGVRVILYFRSDIQRVAQILRKEFQVLEDLDVQKHYPTYHQCIGYRAMHFIVCLNNERVSQPEYLRFAGLKCEVQITTVLEHSWTEFEHDMLYKNRHALSNGEIRELEREFCYISKYIKKADEYMDRIQRKWNGRLRQSIPKAFRCMTLQ